MKNNLLVICFALLFSAVTLDGFALKCVQESVGNKVSFSESMIQNSSAFNLHSAIQESLLDRHSPEYILLS